MFLRGGQFARRLSVTIQYRQQGTKVGLQNGFAERAPPELGGVMQGGPSPYAVHGVGRYALCHVHVIGIIISITVRGAVKVVVSVGGLRPRQN